VGFSEGFNILALPRVNLLESPGLPFGTVFPSSGISRSFSSCKFAPALTTTNLSELPDASESPFSSPSVSLPFEGAFSAVQKKKVCGNFITVCRHRRPFSTFFPRTFFCWKYFPPVVNCWRGFILFPRPFSHFVDFRSFDRRSSFFLPILKVFVFGCFR